MNESFMSDERHEQLMKAAEETIGLLNLPGMDPSAALAKVATDHDMNDNEIDLVAHAVNNSRQLAHIESSPPADREKPFPLIDTDKTKKVFKQQPATNAETFSGGRYGTQEEPSEMATNAVEKGSDAIDTKERVDKTASAYLKQFWPRKSSDHETAFSNALGLTTEKVAAAQLTAHDDPWRALRKLSSYCVSVDEARTRADAEKVACLKLLDSVAEDMRRTVAPAWRKVAQVCAAHGLDQEFFDLAYARTNLAKFGEAQVALEKCAERIYADADAIRVAAAIVQAAEHLQKAADYTAAGVILQEKHDTQLRGMLAAKTAGVWDFVPRFDVDPGEVSKTMGDAAKDYFVEPEVLARAVGHPASTERIDMDARKSVPHKTRQYLQNVEARDMLESLMQDTYIRGHELPDVLEAYNDAMSVNPRFGRAELVSYIRQHLATQGAVPLELQIKAREKRRKDTEEDNA